MKKKIFLALIFLLILAFARVLREGKNFFWDGKSQLSLAIETQSKKIIVFAITPAKNLATVLIIPPNLKVETPWFGVYRADKLSLLAKQEGKEMIFPRSLEYFLGIPIDRGIIDSRLAFDQGDETTLKIKLRGLFFPARSIGELRIWWWLRKKELVWQIVDLANFSQQEILPDQSTVLVVDSEKISDRLFGLFTDPLVKNENIPLSIFNSGGPSGLAQRTAVIATQFGARVVEVADAQREGDECLILFSQPKLTRTATFRRLKSVFGCREEEGRGEGLGEIQIFVKNVKI